MREPKDHFQTTALTEQAEEAPSGANEFQETELGPLPAHWKVVRLGEVVEKMRSGGTPSRSNPAYWNGDIPFVLIEDMTRCGLYLTQTKERITQAGIENSSAWIVPPGTLLLSMYATIGETAINAMPIATNQAILAIIPKPEFDVEYGAYLMKYHAERLKQHNIQSTQKNVNKGIVASLTIPLPPLEEQRAIARVLRAVQQARDATQQVIDAAQQLKKSLMQRLFTCGVNTPAFTEGIEQNPSDGNEFQETELGSLPAHWKVVRLGEVVEKMRSGGTPSRSNPAYWNGDIPFVLIEDMTRCGLYLTQTKERITQAGIENSSAWIVPPGTLLLSMYATIGETAINAMPIATNQAILAIIPKPEFDVEYGAYLMKYHAERLKQHNIQSTQKNVNKGIVASLTIPLPPLEEQRAIASVLKAVDAKIAAERARRDALNDLLQTLLRDLMSGRRRAILTPEFTGDTGGERGRDSSLRSE